MLQKIKAVVQVFGKYMDRSLSTLADKVIFHPGFAIILALLLVVLVEANVINVRVAVPIICAWAIAMLWISRTENIRKLPFRWRLPLLLAIALLLAAGGSKFGYWALGHHYQQKQGVQKQPIEKNESMIKPPLTALKEPTGKTPPTRQKQQPPLSPPKESQADVALRFVYPKSPALMILNLSDSIARDIKWAVVVWNMDLPDRNDPLPIPVSTFDWLKPRDEGGPQDLFNGPLVAPLLKTGNRLFGSASVDCPACARGRTYIVYIVWGEGGWFSEVENGKSGRIIIPPNFLKDSREKYFKTLEATIPEISRLPIGER